MIYWVIVAIWAIVLCSVIYFYVRNPRVFGTTRLLLVVIGIDTLRNIFENVYFGLYFGAQYGVFPAQIVGVLGRLGLLLIPKLMNVAKLSGVYSSRLLGRNLAIDDIMCYPVGNELDPAATRLLRPR